MEVGTHIRTLRTQAKLSQEELAERVMVSRQTISNWETGKFYPDIESLLRMSDLFSVPIDSIVKGDLIAMSEKITYEQVKRLNEDSVLYGALLVFAALLTPAAFLTSNGLALAAGLALFAVAIFLAFRLERQKREYDIHTYQEILAFSQGESVESIRSRRMEESKALGIVLKVLTGASIAIVACVLVDVALNALGVI